VVSGCDGELVARQSLLYHEKTKFGCSSRLMRTGDKVVVLLLGGSSAYVLRKRSSGNTWQFMHAAYVHGLMNRETFGMLDQKEVEKEFFTSD